MDILVSERLQLRPFLPSDLDALHKVFGDPEVMRFGDGVQSRAWVRSWIHRYSSANPGNPNEKVFAVVETRTLMVIGYCGLFYFPDVAGQPEVEIGYRLVRSHWGQGYATEAVCRVRDFALNLLGMSRLVAIIDPDNAASIRVAEKAGFLFEKPVTLEGYTYADHLYRFE